MRCRTALSRVLTLSAAAILALGLGGCPLTPGGGGGGGGGFNLPPVPVITSDVTRGVAPLTVKFGSERSTDDGVIVSRSWDFGDGETSTEISPNHTFDTTGDFTVTLTLTDDQAASASKTVTVAVTNAPVAVLSADRTHADSAPALISFDGSDSFDPDGEIVDYEWQFGDGSREFIQTVTHVYASSGTYTAKLIVTDDKGVTGSTEQLIQIGIKTPTIEIRVPPPDVENIVLSAESPAWIQAVYEIEPGVAHFTRAGFDRDTDQCNAQSDLYGLGTASFIRSMTGQDDRVTDVAFSPDGTRVAAASDDGTVRVYATSTGDVLSEFTGNGQIGAVAYSPGGTRIAWGQSDGDVVVVEASSGAIVRTFSGHTATINDLVFSAGGDEVFSASSDRHALLWSVTDGTILRDFQHALAVNAVAISPGDPDMVATGSEDTTIKVWNITSGAELLTLEGHSGAVNALAFSPDGLALISASDDKNAIAWSPFFGTADVIYSGHDDAVTAVAISPDGTTVVTGSADGTARVWASDTGEEQASVQPCESTISSVDISPDGTMFVVGVAARNDILLDTDPPNGNDLNITTPQALMLQNVASLGGATVPSGRYFLWAEISSDQTSKAIRTYANAQINLLDAFDTTVDVDTPVIPLVNNEASVVIPADRARQVFDLGPLDRGDRLFVSQLSTPGFGEFYEPTSEFSIMLLDAGRSIVAWYEAIENMPRCTLPSTVLRSFVLFTPDTRLIIGHGSLHHYVVVDGGGGVHVRLQPASGLAGTHPQRVFVDFRGGAAVAAGGEAARPIPVLDASDFNQFFPISPGWGANETAILKATVMAAIQNVYADYDIEFTSSDSGQTPALPFLTVYVGGRTPNTLYGIADYVDPRNETATGTAIAYALQIGEDGIGGSAGWSNPISSVQDLGNAIGRVAAHEIGHLLGLRNTDDPADIMQGACINDVADPTIPRVLKTSLVTITEQLGAQTPVGFQNAPQLLQETIGLAP